MDPAASSTAVTESSCISSESPPPAAATSQLLEISLISAQDLSPISKSIHTYAVAWIRPNRKHTTRTDHRGQRNPKWNDKFVFSLDEKTVLPEKDATVTVEIYTVSWFRDVLVGMVRVRVADLITPLTQTRNKTTRFVALQIRRPSGSPQGILNMGVALCDTAMRSMPLSKNHFHQHNKNDVVDVPSIQLWRSFSAGGYADDLIFPEKPGSVCNGSTVDNGSDLCSDIGPSASVVAAELAKKPLISNATKITTAADQETGGGSSILEELTVEEAKAKGYISVATSKEMWRRATAADGGDESEVLQDGGGRRRSRRSSDGGLFSCFGNAYGIEFMIVCGAGKNPNGNNTKRSSGRRKTTGSKANSA